jgi:hypothetical protein
MIPATSIFISDWMPRNGMACSSVLWEFSAGEKNEARLHFSGGSRT